MGRKVYRRCYTFGNLQVCVEVVNGRGLAWFANWYGVAPDGGRRFVFGTGGNAASLREAWAAVRDHCRKYGCGDVLYMEAVK